MDELGSLLVLGPLTTVLTVYVIYRAREPAIRLGLVDRPGGRKDHEGEIPLIGGIGIFLGFCFAVMLIETSVQLYRSMFGCMGLLLVMGVLDDLHDLGPLEKILLQAVAAFALIFSGGLLIDTLGSFPGIGELESGWFAYPLTLLVVIGLINAVNMMDGMDGLAGGVVVAMLFWLSVIVLLGGANRALWLPVLLACSVVGFLCYNFPHPWRSQASVFMGDSGSNMLGFAVAWLAIDIGFRPRVDVPPVALAWIVALPVFDTLILMARRVLKGRNPMHPDREHLHHIFERAGFSRLATVYLLVGGAFLMGGVGVLGWQAGIADWILYTGLLGGFFAHCYLIKHAWRVARLLRFLKFAS